MGAYLVTGIAQEIIIEKSASEKYQLTVKELEQCMNGEVKMAHYDYVEDPKYHMWTIKPAVLEPKLPEFITAQWEMYAGQLDQYNKEDIEEVRKAKTYDKLIELAETKKNRCFRFSYNYLNESVYPVNNTGRACAISVDYNHIAIFMDGKAYIDAYGKILRYFEQVIRLQRKEYPIVDCVKCLLTD
jgi:hypothetical protein